MVTVHAPTNSDTILCNYKQISEGFEDRERFAIMTKVGMSREMVRAAINDPLIHNLVVASRGKPEHDKVNDCKHCRRRRNQSNASNHGHQIMQKIS